MKTSADKSYWLVKSEPDSYSWEDFVRDGKTEWTGVRNFAARQHLNAMRRGDRVLFYESVSTKAVVGTAEVTRTAFPDSTADEPGWVAVELKAGAALAKPVTLSAVKAEPALAKMALLRLSRLSVQPVTNDEFNHILKMAR
jgi:predicted RNA-binding protein with PUA-like domain